MGSRKRRAGLIHADLLTDPRFRTLGTTSAVGARAQLLFLALQPFADDQGRLVAETDKIMMTVTPAMPHMRSAHIERCLKAIHETRLGILYEADGQRILQLLDWGEWNTGLRHREPSDIPPPKGWDRDQIKSWQDDTNIAGSRASHEARESSQNGGKRAASARRNPQTAGRGPQSAGTSLSPNRRGSKYKSEVQREKKIPGPGEILSEENGATAPTQDRDQTDVYDMVKTVDRALRQNRVCSQVPILEAGDSGRREREADKIRLWLAEGIDAAWLQNELARLCRTAKKSVWGLGFFDTPVRADWLESKANGPRNQGGSPISERRGPSSATAPPVNVEIVEDPKTGRLRQVQTWSTEDSQFLGGPKSRENTCDSHPL